MHGSYDITLSILAICLFVGIISNLIAKKIQVAPIVFFLGFGILLGRHGLEWISPEPFGAHFLTLLSLGIAIILFEAGLTLDYIGYKRIGSIVIRMLTLGVVLAWVVNALVIHYLFEFDLRFSFLASSLIIVTGPTVIMPILRKINVTKKIFHILHWEGVLIDPIGVFLALLSYEIYIGIGTGTDSGSVWASFLGETGQAILLLGLRVMWGIGVGIVFGGLTVICLNRKWIPVELMNAFVLAMAVLTFSVCDMLIAESGLMGVVVAGLITGFKKNIHINEVKKFKLEITNIFIGLIFVLIASGLDFSNFYRFGWKGIVLLVIVIFVSRPLNVLVSSFRSHLSFREKLFVSWLAPRGILAASMATIFTISLKREPRTASLDDSLWFIEFFTFAVIVSTVLFQGFSANVVAKLLRLVQAEGKKWVIVGAHDFSEKIARFLMKHQHMVMLLDNNKARLTVYRERGLSTLHMDSLSPDIYDDSRLIGVSHVLALTDNLELNALTCQHWKRIVNKNNLYRWGEASEEEQKKQWDGNLIWDFLPKPIIISNHLSDGKSHLLEDPLSYKKDDKKNHQMRRGEEKGNFKKDSSLLLISVSAQKSEVCFANSTNQEELLQSSEGETSLFLMREDFSISSFVDQRLLMIIDEEKLIEGKETKNFYHKLMDRFNHHYTGLFTSDQVDELLLREKERSFSLGNGVAIVYFHRNQVKQSILGLAVVKNGIDLKAYDQLPVKLVFLLVSPQGDSKKHLWIISEISKMMSHEFYRTKLMETTKENILQEHLANFSLKSI